MVFSVYGAILEYIKTNKIPNKSYVPDKKDGRKNDGKNDRTSKLLLNKFTGTVIFAIIFTSIFFYPEHSFERLLNFTLQNKKC